MSKERAAAIQTIKAKMAKDAPEDTAADGAILTLVADGLNSLGRIADALDKIAARVPV